MMLTPLIRRQLKVFTLIAAVALGLTVFVYARVPSALGIGVYDVEVQFADASGLYPQANVTYRGVKVGQVDSMALTEDGATATLRLDSDVDVPREVEAELHTTSAVGEQYVDLVPSSDDGPYLEDGAVITRDHSREMPQISPVLDSLNDLLASVPEAKTRSLLRQLDTGLGGSGEDVGELIDSTGLLVEEAQARIDATTGLIQALDPVLATQQDLASQTLTWSDALAGFTGELADRDADLRSLLRVGPDTLESAEGLVSEVSDTLPLLLANATTDAQVFNTYLPNLEQTLVVYPATIARLQSTVNPRAEQGDVRLDLKATFNDPPHCTDGYLGAQRRRSPSDVSVRRVDGTAHCRAASSAPQGVRGARNLPCPNRPGARGALPADCGLRFRGALRPSTRSSAPYDALSGEFVASDGRTYRLDTPVPTRGEDAWKSLLLGPLGLS